MSYKDKDLYFVAIKVFLRDGDKLLITHDIFSDWDLPGGRIKKFEFDKPLEEVIERKIREELGPDVKYELAGPNGIFFRVEREENDLAGEKVRIFAVGYDAKYLGGGLELGEHHDKYEWVNVNDFRSEDYFTGGWLKGLKEYIEAVP